MAIIKEAFKTTRNDEGQTKFSKHTYEDPHIKHALDLASKKTGIPVATLKKEIDTEMAKFKGLVDKAPVLYTTIYENNIESEIFNMLKKHKVEVSGAPEFEGPMFMDLVSLIKIEHDNFFPLRNIVDHKFVKNEQWILIPSRYEKDKQFANVDTAAATEDGKFIFNKHFCQQLLDFAYIKGLKGRGKKYESNGGKIPDAWVYIEFLIIHEIMHYTQADWHYQKIFKESGQLSNWVGDLRTNYLLVKSGFEQLPIGLFSDKINYDRQSSMREMYDVVKKEFEKLNDKEKKDVEDQLGKMTDDHSHQDQGGEGSPGEGGEGKEKKPGEGKESGEKSDDKEGKPSGGKEPTEEEMEKQVKDNEGKLSDNAGKSGDTDVEAKASEKRGQAQSKVGSAKSKEGGRNGGPIEVKEAKPNFSWNQILSKLVSDAISDPEETYQRANKKSIRSVHLARQTGTASVKPGEISNESSMRLLVYVDCSGSMHGHMSTIFANLKSLIKRHGKQLTQDIYVSKFSDQSDLYLCNLKSNTAYKLDTLLGKKGEAAGTVDALLSETISGGTVFSDKMVHTIHEAVTNKFNVLVISDTDILVDNYKKIALKNKGRFYTIWASKSDFNQAVNYLGVNLKNMTYISS